MRNVDAAAQVFLALPWIRSWWSFFPAMSLCGTDGENAEEHAAMASKRTDDNNFAIGIFFLLWSNVWHIRVLSLVRQIFGLFFDFRLQQLCAARESEYNLAKNVVEGHLLHVLRRNCGLPATFGLQFHADVCAAVRDTLPQHTMPGTVLMPCLYHTPCQLWRFFSTP
jgi:hypothetical protein